MKSITQLIACSVLFCASGLSMAASDSPSAPQPGQMPMHDQMQNKMQQHMKEMDSNGDGNLSKQEFMANCEKRFAKMDSNADGQISQQERQQMKAQMMQHKGQMGGQTGTP